MSTKTSNLNVTVIGGGVVGLWQALTLARHGHSVTLYEAAPEDANGAASRLAGAMLAPYCEAEAAQATLLSLGVRGLGYWRKTDLGVDWKGTLVLAAERDEPELKRFSRMTVGHRALTAAAVGEIEPALADRFRCGLYYPDEGHLMPRRLLTRMVQELRSLGAVLRFSTPVAAPLWMAGGAGESVIDCRGISVRHEEPELRGIRGEMAVLSCPSVRLSRPVRLLHPRFPVYVVPWREGTYMIGATSIESEQSGPVTLKSALELLASAYALHPGFAEARLVELSAGIRPAFPDNLPKIVPRGRRLLVNGAYRHGFLLAPVLAEVVADHLETGADFPAELKLH